MPTLESPLDLRKDIATLECKIESLEELKPSKKTRLYIKILILKDRLSLMKRGTGFTAGFTIVREHEIDEIIQG